jgi:hypothetical protein
MWSQENCGTYTQVTYSQQDRLQIKKTEVSLDGLRQSLVQEVYTKKLVKQIWF